MNKNIAKFLIPLAFIVEEAVRRIIELGNKTVAVVNGDCMWICVQAKARAQFHYGRMGVSCCGVYIDSEFPYIKRYAIQI